VTLERREVSTKVSRMSPPAVPAGTLVTAAPEREDSKVVAVPTWLMVVVAVAVDASRGTAALMPVIVRRTAIDVPRNPIQQCKSDGGPRRTRLPDRRMLFPWAN
jgi:hypothetical protein